MPSDIGVLADWLAHQMALWRAGLLPATRQAQLRALGAVLSSEAAPAAPQAAAAAPAAVPAVVTAPAAVSAAVTAPARAEARAAPNFSRPRVQRVATLPRKPLSHQA